MRKLIIAGIISVLAMIGWISYLKYDMNRFMKDLGSSPIQKQHDRSTTTNLVKTPAIDGSENEQSEQDNTQTFSQKERHEGITQTIKTSADTEGNIDDLVPEQIRKDNKISPELEKLFIEHNNLYQQSVEVSKVLAPLINRTIELNQRLLVIGQELSAARDEGTKRKVLSEWEAIDKWIEDMKPKFTRLEGEAELLSNKRLSLVSEYGFSSEDDFLKTHGMVYRTWLSDQE